MRRQCIGVGDVGVLRRDGRYVYYLVTKEKYHDKPSMSSLKAALSAMRGRIVANDVRRLAMPQIGCGLDRLAWDEVKDLISSPSARSLWRSKCEPYHVKGRLVFFDFYKL